AVEDAASTLGGLSAITTAAFTERPVTAATGERATTASTIDAFRAGTADTVRQSADQHLAEEASSGLGDPSDGQDRLLHPLPRLGLDERGGLGKRGLRNLLHA
ncbi:unnamed protein product, partial [Prorocentrum cordatum]